MVQPFGHPRSHRLCIQYRELQAFRRRGRGSVQDGHREVWTSAQREVSRPIKSFSRLQFPGNSLKKMRFVSVSLAICKNYPNGCGTWSERFRNWQKILISKLNVNQNNNQYCYYLRSFLNVCLAYTSQNEIIRAMQNIQSNVHSGHTKITDINENTFNQALDTKNSLPVDMLIRTSGEHRLSDFMLWQVSQCPNDSK